MTKYQQHRLSCQACGAVTAAELPEEMPRGNFGPRAQAIIGYLTGRLALSHRDVVEAMEATRRKFRDPVRRLIERRSPNMRISIAELIVDGSMFPLVDRRMDGVDHATLAV